MKKTSRLIYALPGRKHLLNTLGILTSLILIVLTFHSLHFGIPWNDESAHILPSYKFLLGQTPFVDEFNPIQLTSLLTYPFFKLFYVFHHHQLDGIFIFERRLYTVIAIVSCFFLIRLIRFYLPLYAAILIGVNLISFAPLGLHSPFYDSFALLFLTLGFFSLSIAVNLSPSSHKNSKWMFFASGILLGLAASIYPPLIVCWFFIGLACPYLNIEKLKFYFMGLGFGVLWLALVLSYVAITNLSALIFSWEMIRKFAHAQSKWGIGLKPMLTWYAEILKSLSPMLSILVILRLLAQKFKQNRVWQILLGISLLGLLGWIVFAIHSPFGNGMGFTVALFLACPFLYSYLNHHSQAKIMFRCIWIPSLVSILVVTLVSATHGLSTVIAAFSGSLVSLIFVCFIYKSFVKPLWFQKICLVSGLLMTACAYQAANLKFFYSTEAANALPTQACFKQGPLKELCTSQQGILFMNDLEQKLQPLSGQKKTLSIFSIINIGYFTNGFIPFTYNAYESHGDTMVHFFDNTQRYPDVIVTINPLLPYWDNDQYTNFTMTSPLSLTLLSQRYQLYDQDDYLKIYIKK